jgi:hypothetical protein
MVDIKQPINIQGIPSVAIKDDVLRIDTGLGYSVGDCTSRVIMSCEETGDAFIFSVINEFINEHHKIEVSKEELAAAVELIRKRRACNKKYNVDILRDNIRASEMMMLLNNAYARGYSDCMVDYDLVRKE